MKLISKVNVNVTGMDSLQEAKIVLAADHLLRFFRSEFFKKKLLNVNLHTLLGESSSSVSKRLSQKALYDLFMSGKEEWNNKPDYEIDLKVVRYVKWWSKVKGYIIPMQPEIFVNGKFFDVSSILLIASNLAHEWSHTLGFRHSGTFMRESIPYLINEWFEEWYLTYAIVGPTNEIATYKTICKRTWWTLWLLKRCYRIVR